MRVHLGAWDWAFVAWFLLVTCGVGLWYARRASKNLSEYFVSGRDLPWWALGTSMVATTFAADTPIVISGWVVTDGIARNWEWWGFIVGGALTVFLFSRWWRRAGVMTEIELLAIRYDGTAAKVLRGFKAVYLGLVLNSIIIGWVVKAMGQVLAVVFGPENELLAMGILLAAAFGYALLSGLWGVVAADVLQFAMAWIGAILLAVMTVSEVGGLGELVSKVEGLGAEKGIDFLAFVPDAGTAAMTVFTVLVLVNWWAVYYPGAEPGGGGYVAQRMLAARDERHARAGTLWFTIAHYVLRPWPWILVGLSAMALEPQFAGGKEEGFTGEQSYPAMMEFLPVGTLGLVVASFFAAFMSTITTQLNLAASYLVNDLYIPFCAKDPDQGHRGVLVSRFACAIVMVVGAMVAYILETAGDGWVVIRELTAGIGLVLIARWLWWRINAWSEISAMLASAAFFSFFKWTPWGESLVESTSLALSAVTDDSTRGVMRLLLTVVGSTLVWIVVTLRSRPVAQQHLEAFYRRVRPGGMWAPLASVTGIATQSMKREFALWVAGSALILGALFGIGGALLLRTSTAVVGLGVALIAGLIVVWGLRADRGVAARED